MRKTDLVTVSLPPSIRLEAERIAKKEGMTRSELLRSALRRYIEEKDLEEALRVADEELATGKVKILPKGGLAAMLKKK